MIINLTVFVYEPLCWRVTADVVFVALFSSNRRLFSEIVAYQWLFCMVTLLGSSNNHDDGEGNVKIIGLIDKQKKNLNLQRTFWQISLPLSSEWRSQTLSKWQCDRTFSPRSDVSEYFLNPQIFLCGFGKSFHVHTCPYSNRICPSYVSGFTLSSSTNL